MAWEHLDNIKGDVEHLDNIKGDVKHLDKMQEEEKDKLWVNFWAK